MQSKNQIQVVIISGMSGAGKTQALHKLEDDGYFCIDNMPANFLLELVESLKTLPIMHKIALGLDGRSPMLDEAEKAIQYLREQKMNLKVIFLTARDEVLLRRYSETRRNHPLAREGSVFEGIQLERKLMKNLKKISDCVLDTSDLKPSEVKEKIQEIIGNEEGKFFLLISSFGFKYGMPVEADWIIDVRFLPNPYWIKELKMLSGKDKPVRDYIFSFPEATNFIKRCEAMMKPLIPDYQKEGKNRLSLCIACTGGQHRSVCIAEEMAKRLAGDNITIKINHRDMR